MADVDLTSSAANLVYLKNKLKETGIGYQELAAAIYNLTVAVHAICNNLDVDAGTLGTDYMAKIGTPLASAQYTSKVEKPHGTTTEA